MKRIMQGTKKGYIYIEFWNLEGSAGEPNTPAIIGPIELWKK
jgi:hypothetical protein